MVFIKLDKNNNILGCYTPRIHETLFDEKDGKKIPKFDKYIEVEEEEYKKLLLEQSEKNGEFLVKEGKLIVYVKKPCTKTFLNKSYDYNKETWVEKASKEAVKNEYLSKIDKLKVEIQSIGMSFNYNGVNYKQKCRSSDISSMRDKIDAMKLASKKSCIWYFNDIPVELSLDDMVRLFTQAVEFQDYIFSTENKLKNKNPNLDININDYIDEINNTSIIKCFK